jgi:hypothetical protein
LHPRSSSRHACERGHHRLGALLALLELRRTPAQLRKCPLQPRTAEFAFALAVCAPCAPELVFQLVQRSVSARDRARLLAHALLVILQHCEQLFDPALAPTHGSHPRVDLSERLSRLSEPLHRRVALASPALPDALCFEATDRFLELHFHLSPVLGTPRDRRFRAGRLFDLLLKLGKLLRVAPHTSAR